MLREIPSLDVIRGWVNAYRAEPGRDGAFPDAKSGKIPGTEITWRALSDAFREGRVLDERVSFGWWLKTEFPAEYRPEIQITHDFLRDAVDAFRTEFNGAFPNAHSGNLPGTSVTWFAVDAKMKEGAFPLDGPMQKNLGIAPRYSLGHWLYTHYPDYAPTSRAVEDEPISATVKKRRRHP